VGNKILTEGGFTMKHIFKLLMITFLIASIGIVYAQDGIDKKKDEIVKEKSKDAAKQEPSERLAGETQATKEKAPESPSVEKTVPASLSSKAVAPSAPKSASTPTTESLKAAPAVRKNKR